MTYLADAREELERITRARLYRRLPPDEPRYVADFSSNDYLALAADSRMVEALRHAKRVGSGGARLLGGRHREHFLLEQDLAQWLGRERALLFSSGYMGALGAIPVLARFADVIYSDALNHACLIDGIRSARVPCKVYAHGHVPRGAERSGRSLIVTESLFGMDGDVVDIAKILEGMGEQDMLLVDEAHALGVMGDEGRGLAGTFPDERIVVLGTLGKAIGSAGGFIAGPAALIELLVNTARTFIFDTAPPPAIAFASRVGILLARGAADRRSTLGARVNRLKNGLLRLGYDVPPAHAPIIPILTGDESSALALMERCLQRGIYAPAIRPPTVPPGSSRLRISVRADHTDEQIDLLLERL